MDARNEPLSPLGLWILQAQREILSRHSAGGRTESTTDSMVSPGRRNV
jgi:hypothetical protein